ncbi:MAG: WcaI family glycosyltransferase [Burkholderiales bacterium]
MKILIHSINYFPELTGIGKYSGEMAEWLALRGHEIRVVTAPPYYPEWRIGRGYSGARYSSEIIREVNVLRCPLWVPQKLSGLKRITHLASFAWSSLPVMLWQVFWKPDIVFVVEPPLFCSPGAWLVARLSGAKAWLHVQDFEVDAAFDLKILPAGRIRDIIRFIEKIMMRRFDRISTISTRMMEKLEGKGVGRNKAILFPNWVDTEAIFPRETRAMRQELGLLEDKVVCLYSGNMGEKQGLEILIEAARLLQEEKSIRFVLCGNGTARESLYESANDLSNIAWLPLQPLEKLNDLLNMADIHLLPQRADAADLVMPSKLAGMLASGKPVVATAKAGTEIAQVLEKCGKLVEPGDATELADAIFQLAGNASLRKALGEEARRYALGNLTRDAVLSRLEAEFHSMVAEP